MARSKTTSSWRKTVAPIFVVLVLTFASGWLSISSGAKGKSLAMRAQQTAPPLTNNFNVPIEALAPCSCVDKDDLLNRYLYDMIAANAYKDYQDAEDIRRTKEVNDLAGSGAPIPEMTNYSADGWAAIQNKLNQFINRNYNQPTNSFGSWHNEGDCKVDFDAPTACLRSVYQYTADNLRRRCQAKKDKGDPFSNLIEPLVSPPPLMELVVRHESERYASEANHITDLLAHLPDECKTRGWSGTIEYNEGLLELSKRDIPPVPNGTLGGSETKEFHRTFTITITLENDVAFFKYDFKDTTKQDQENTSIIRCHTNEKVPHQYPHYSRSASTTEAHGSGKPLRVRIDVNNEGFVSVSFATPRIDGNYSNASDASAPDDCPGAKSPPMQSNKSAMPRGEFSYSARGKSVMSLNHITGHDNKMVGGGSISVTWDLRPPK